MDGLSVAQTAAFSGSDAGAVDERSNECSICLAVFEDRTVSIHPFACKHYFHRACAYQWVTTPVQGYPLQRQRCPNCRAVPGEELQQKIINVGTRLVYSTDLLEEVLPLAVAVSDSFAGRQRVAGILERTDLDMEGASTVLNHALEVALNDGLWGSAELLMQHGAVNSDAVRFALKRLLLADDTLQADWLINEFAVNIDSAMMEDALGVAIQKKSSRLVSFMLTRTDLRDGDVMRVLNKMLDVIVHTATDHEDHYWLIAVRLMRHGASNPEAVQDALKLALSSNDFRKVSMLMSACEAQVDAALLKELLLPAIEDDNLILVRFILNHVNLNVEGVQAFLNDALGSALGRAGPLVSSYYVTLLTEHGAKNPDAVRSTLKRLLLAGDADQISLLISGCKVAIDIDTAMLAEILHAAISGNNTQLARFILTKVDLEDGEVLAVLNTVLSSAVVAAMEMDHWSIVDELVEHGASHPDIMQSALKLSLFRNNPGQATKLINQYGAKIDTVLLQEALAVAIGDDSFVLAVFILKNADLKDEGAQGVLDSALGTALADASTDCDWRYVSLLTGHGATSSEAVQSALRRFLLAGCTDPAGRLVREFGATIDPATLEESLQAAIDNSNKRLARFILPMVDEKDGEVLNVLNKALGHVVNGAREVDDWFIVDELVKRGAGNPEAVRGALESALFRNDLSKAARLAHQCSAKIDTSLLQASLPAAIKGNNFEQAVFILKNADLEGEGARAILDCALGTALESVASDWCHVRLLAMHGATNPEAVRSALKKFLLAGCTDDADRLIREFGGKVDLAILEESLQSAISNSNKQLARFILPLVDQQDGEVLNVLNKALGSIVNSAIEQDDWFIVDELVKRGASNRDAVQGALKSAITGHDLSKAARLIRKCEAKIDTVIWEESLLAAINDDSLEVAEFILNNSSLKAEGVRDILNRGLGIMLDKVNAEAGWGLVMRLVRYGAVNSDAVQSALKRFLLALDDRQVKKLRSELGAVISADTLNDILQIAIALDEYVCIDIALQNTCKAALGISAVLSNALHTVVESGQMAIAVLLMKHGARPDACTLEKLLYLAIHRRDTRLVRLILSNTDQNTDQSAADVQRSLNDALVFAVTVGQNALADLLIEHGATDAEAFQVLLKQSIDGKDMSRAANMIRTHGAVLTIDTLRKALYQAISANSCEWFDWFLYWADFRLEGVSALASEVLGVVAATNREPFALSLLRLGVRNPEAMQEFLRRTIVAGKYELADQMILEFGVMPAPEILDKSMKDAIFTGNEEKFYWVLNQAKEIPDILNVGLRTALGVNRKGFADCLCSYGAVRS